MLKSNRTTSLDSRFVFLQHLFPPDSHTTQRLKELESQLKSDRAAERRARNEKRRLKEEKKKENEIKHAIKHQGAVYVDTRKVRKMDLKARKQLMKVSAEIIQERFGKKH
eukprot:Blabericola_migrator_1__8006@NODE_4104_length_1332_cov_16_766008_g2537_i0_p3_GENE_NODE_4104_length_1332_cov_16_766008_g2537_i0NODE_4104_length_1332_cov_16_766008_g2537_i0_p3_ORF_typecomplete_len110_score33_37Cgr1/PF03879_14/0_0012PTPlike_phytase/PF14566_6/0_024CEP19/PF14933_6/0_052SpoIIIAH/PF12685_7/0_16Sugarporin_N/PF11471_8/0_25AAA_23/PF13476_6/0_23LKAAEAR/PF15478_6/0_075LKAAEAR/PF15478_6/2_1e03Mto2_bdg/PF12808_7/0_21Mto2_bdg/PF12808_7/6_1e03DUF2570/PF10828_8/3_3_NODE_4104_length_1332_cov_16_7